MTRYFNTDKISCQRFKASKNAKQNIYKENHTFRLIIANLLKIKAKKKFLKVARERHYFKGSTVRLRAMEIMEIRIRRNKIFESLK